jgi:hypothetical protein
MKIIYYFFFYLSFLVFYSTFDFLLSPDFEKYYKYFEYYSGTIPEPGAEQGHLYFFIPYLVTKIVYIIDNSLTMNQLINISLHLYNSFLIIVGFRGFIQFMNTKDYKTYNSYLISIPALFFGPLVYLRLSFKPEILFFSFIFWFLMILERYIKLEKKQDLVKAVILFTILATSKASITFYLLILSIFLLIKYRREFSKKNIVTSIILFVFLFTLTSLENYRMNNLLLTEVNHAENYDYKADLNFLTNINSENFINNPNKYFHSDSFISIVLFDTFTDFFGLYWNSEYTELNTERKQFFEVEKRNSVNKIPQIRYDLDQSVFTFYGDFDTRWDDLNYIDETRSRFGFIASLIFYSSIFFMSFLSKFRMLLSLPFVGMLVVGISVLGIFGNNYDPEVSDSVKVFYYSFFIVISYLILSSELFKFRRFPKILYIILTLFLFLFFLGFPFLHSYETSANLAFKLSLLPFCNINYHLIDILFQSNSEIICIGKTFIDSSFNAIVNIPKLDFNLSLTRIPLLNISLIFIFILYHYYEKLSSIKKN